MEHGAPTPSTTTISVSAAAVMAAPSASVDGANMTPATTVSAAAGADVAVNTEVGRASSIAADGTHASGASGAGADMTVDMANDAGSSEGRHYKVPFLHCLRWSIGYSRCPAGVVWVRGSGRTRPTTARPCGTAQPTAAVRCLLLYFLVMRSSFSSKSVPPSEAVECHTFGPARVTVHLMRAAARQPGGI